MEGDIGALEDRQWLTSRVFEVRRRCPVMWPMRRRMRHSDGLDARESVGDAVVLSRDVLYIGRELDYKVEIVKFPW